jgi:alkylhydroperoxidase family enzyme
MAGSCSEAAAAPRRMDNDEFSAIKAAGYTDQQFVDIRLAIAVTTFTNVFNRINDTAIDFPAR